MALYARWMQNSERNESYDATNQLKVHEDTVTFTVLVEETQ
jgi:hypothetical protein